MTGTEKQTPRHLYWPLYAAGFVTAVGAHSIAANLATYGQQQHASLLTIGLLLAVYDAAEVILKPVFGTLVDRVGPRPVLIGGLIGFACASVAFVAAGDPGLLGAARFGQGAAAAAFSPAASTLVARLQSPGGHARRFGSYGAWKGLGYTLGPLLGGALVALGGYGALFACLGGLAVLVAVWAAAIVPRVEPLPRRRSTVVDLARRLTRRAFLVPTLILAASTAALSIGVGFFPILATSAGAGAVLSGALVSLLSACAALSQPWAGRALDARRIGYRAGAVAGAISCGIGFLLAGLLGGPAGLTVGAVAIGVGAGVLTPLGFAALAASAPQERLGETMGSAEVGRELGDAGGPILVGAVAGVATLGLGCVAAAALMAGVAALAAVRGGEAPTSGAS
ncbi:MFS transporter [Mycolicibacterium sp. 018/SC-01/001]|uniref:MFS transporter n=1 Tax=Mycolicibacterium sp. 018/SC-01/001 TaxID=2592069 RepID=UPI00117FE800|nr:MFS transporter [Mycolicibacterium sp. 018/SC-01/001]TRW88313.1 MFS transporter [Mycolicibacterium sp. 018/SC-01/001]